MSQKESEEIREEFYVGEYNFSIGKENSIIKIEGNYIVDLTIKADESVFRQLCELDEFPFDWALYPPEFYVWEVDLGKTRQITINEKNRYDYDAGLYFMEHCDASFHLIVEENRIFIKGLADVWGKKYPVRISLRY